MSTMTSGGAARHDDVERGRLRHGARKTLQNEPLPGIRLIQPLPHDTNHHVVADQLAPFHDGLDAQPGIGARVDGLAKDVSRRDSRNPAGAREPLGLSSLAGPWRSEHDQIRRHVTLVVSMRTRS